MIHELNKHTEKRYRKTQKRGRKTIQVHFEMKER
jgi:hypothetical protein